MNSKLTCLCCKESYPAESEWVVTPRGRFYSYDHLQVYVKAQKALKLFRANAKKLKDKKKANAAFDKKVRDNDLPRQIRLTQDVFNKWVKERDYAWFASRGIEPYCISCGIEKGGDSWCCGHYKTVGGFPELRFDPMNAYLQHNRRCNDVLSADIEGSKTTMGYKKGLIQRFGQEEGQAILDYCEKHHEPKHYTCEQLIAMRKQMNVEIREFERARG